MDKFKVRGSSMVEFVIVAPLLAGIGLGTVQAGLVYHGKTILNYATFEAARTGAVHNAKLGPMRFELGTRLAPIHGGDGSSDKAAEAIADSLAEIALLQDSLTHIEVLNPTREAFNHFKVLSRESGVEVIPNSHLRHQSQAVDPVSGVNLQDANLLKIRVTYGFELKVPLVSHLVGAVMTRVDPEHAHYYATGRLPISSVATVRMQSEVHGDFLQSASAPPAASRPPLHNNALVAEGPADTPENAVVAAPDNLLADGTFGEHASINCDPFFGGDPFLPVVDAQACAAGPVNSSPVLSDELAAGQGAC